MADPFSDSLLKSFLDKTTLKLRNKNWGCLLESNVSLNLHFSPQKRIVSDKSLIHEMYRLLEVEIFFLLYPDCGIRFPPLNFPPFLNYRRDMPRLMVEITAISYLPE